MIEDYLLPRPLPEKLKFRFLGNTLKIGEQERFEGFILRIPKERSIRDILWNKISPALGDFSVKGITPFPEDGFPVMLLVVPKWINLKFSFGWVEGRIYDLSQFSNLEGRFLIVENAGKISIEKYLIGEKPGLTGRKIYNIFDTSFTESSRDIMLSFFLSSGNYLGRIGGCTISLLNALSKHYASNFHEIESLIKDLNPLIIKNSVKVNLLYDENIEVTARTSMKIKYEMMKETKAGKFYVKRHGREWEKSAITDTSIKMENLINSAELAFIPYPEEMQVNGDEVKEYSLDLAIYVLQKHLENPEINIESIEPVKEKIIRKIDTEFPLISEAMKMGIVMDMSDVNGFGEHIGRLLDSWERLSIGEPVDNVLKIYTTLFERIEDVMHTKLKSKISALSEKKRFERMVNRVLWELNVLKPDGWDYFYFEKKIKERGISRNPEKILNELLKDGIVIRKRNDRFLAVDNV